MKTKEKLNISSMLAVVFVVAAVNSVAVYGVVVDFDDLDYGVDLTGSGYAGLTWETGNEGFGGKLGVWRVAWSENSFPHSPPHNAWNVYGATLMGIGFDSPVDVIGAYFAGGSDSPDMLADGVRVHGYLGGTEVAVTGWFMDIDYQPDWFAMNLLNVDRIVIEADPGPILMGYPVGNYGMDGLTYVPEPTTLLLCALGGLALLRKPRA
ncbi:MAG: hypothetical protein ACYS21_15620 [Planctomycetota bacterium]|jgi:hypothetical protein